MSTRLFPTLQPTVYRLNLKVKSRILSKWDKNIRADYCRPFVHFFVTSGTFPARRTFTSFTSISNQNGAPKLNESPEITIPIRYCSQFPPPPVAFRPSMYRTIPGGCLAIFARTRGVFFEQTHESGALFLLHPIGTFNCYNKFITLSNCCTVVRLTESFTINRCVANESFKRIKPSRSLYFKGLFADAIILFEFSVVVTADKRL